MLYTDELDYNLPTELIATHPAEPRDHSRLLVYHREADLIEHRIFSDLPDLLNPGDLLIANDTRVIPAKLSLLKETGGMITGLFIAEIFPGTWRVMLRTRGKARPGIRLTAMAEKEAGRFYMTLLERTESKGQWIVEVNDARPAAEVLASLGEVPLPPYIEKAREFNEQPVSASCEAGAGSVAMKASQQLMHTADDLESYQTIYARSSGSLAAPTAGLHFTPNVFTRLTQRYIQRAWVTLHVGLGTFLPVESATLDNHPMHHESFLIPSVTVEKIRRQKMLNRRLVLVGTTTVRTLETLAEAIENTALPACDLTGSTNLLIQPGYNFRLTDVLLTNFHLPRSTLLALVGALIGLDCLKDIYRQAIAQRYRFYSFGDAMLVLP